MKCPTYLIFTYLICNSDTTSRATTADARSGPGVVHRLYSHVSLKANVAINPHKTKSHENNTHFPHERRVPQTILTMTSMPRRLPGSVRCTDMQLPSYNISKQECAHFFGGSLSSVCARSRNSCTVRACVQLTLFKSSQNAGKKAQFLQIAQEPI